MRMRLHDLASHGLVHSPPRYCTKHVDQDWNLRENGWRLLSEGETPIEINVTFPVSPDKAPAAMAGLTAYSVINAVPYVWAAPPGIQTTADLPIMCRA